MKIDLVYLWVDGGDKKWLAKKNVALASLGRPADVCAADDARFIEHDELKYSLRSAERFAPWVNRIFIVSDNQIPNWLDVKNPKIALINHKDIIPAGLLPTFNSNMIELFLHKIPDLSEHFLYANDDTFFGRPVSPDFFFDAAGNPIVIMGARRWAGKFYCLGWRAGGFIFFQFLANSLKYAFDKTGIKFQLRAKHAIEPMRRSYLADNIDQDYDYFVKTTATRFREKTNLQRMVFPLLDNAKGRNKIVDKFIVFRKRISIARPHSWAWRFVRIAAAAIFGRLESGNAIIQHGNIGKKAARLRRRPAAVFCLNNMNAELAEFLRTEFPKKSRFEK